MPLDGHADLLELGLSIRQRRIDAGWTQAQLATQAGCSQAALSLFEQSGKGLKLERLVVVLKQLGLMVLVDERSAYESVPS